MVWSGFVGLGFRFGGWGLMSGVYHLCYVYTKGCCKGALGVQGFSRSLQCAEGPFLITSEDFSSQKRTSVPWFWVCVYIHIYIYIILTCRYDVPVL